MGHDSACLSIGCSHRVALHLQACQTERMEIASIALLVPIHGNEASWPSGPQGRGVQKNLVPAPRRERLRLRRIERWGAKVWRSEERDEGQGGRSCGVKAV